MLEKIEKLNIETFKLRSDGTYGMFVLEPLQSGYGNTLGNSLRRVLLSSLPGVAATSVKIEGVQHEFSTIPGVKEDVTEIILNIKGLRAKMYGEAPKTIYIEAEGECEVTAGDIKTDSEVECTSQRLARARSCLWTSLSTEAEAMFRRSRTKISSNPLSA